MSQIMEMPSCWWCGEESPLMAQASRLGPPLSGFWLTRYFCHTDARSCYKECSGRYFEVPRNGGKK
jgi:hypothetical protein